MNRLVLAFVVLQRKRVPRFDVQDFSDIESRVGKCNARLRYVVRQGALLEQAVEMCLRAYCRLLAMIRADECPAELTLGLIWVFLNAGSGVVVESNQLIPILEQRVGNRHCFTE